jgi:DNA-binding response OmpR family regulator
MQPAVLDVLRGVHAYRIPTLALIEQLTDSQEVMLLGSGALDVVGLPTSAQRLRTRVLAMQRYSAMSRPQDEEEERHVVGELVIHVGRREVMVGDTPINVTKTEFDLLLALARHPRKVLTREELALQALQGRTRPPTSTRPRRPGR